MNTSAMVTLDESPSRAKLRGVSSSLASASDSGDAPSQANPYTALIDAKLAADRRIEQLAARVRELSAQLAIAEQHARRALAQDLHDDAGAALTAANLALARADFWLPADAPDACADALRQARACVAEVADTCHRIVEGWHEPSFDDGIESAFRSWIAAFGARAGVRIEFVCPHDLAAARLSRECALALFRVMQEALGNVARHAQAARASVVIAIDAHAITLVVEDDGVGISAIARRKSGRFGLSGMRARCEALGGSLRVASAKTGGASVRARLPWANAPARGVLRAVNG